MGLFNKTPKKLTLDEILEGIKYLSDDEKEKVKAKMDDLYKAEDEREIDKIEEDKAEDTEVKDEKTEEVQEESEEIGKDVDEVEDEIEADEPKENEYSEDKPEEVPEVEEEVETEEEVVEEPTEEAVETPEEQKEEDDKFEALFARLQTVEDDYANLMKKYDELYSMLDDKEKNANFGATPTPSEDDETERKDNSVYRAYAGNNAHKYY